MSEELYQRKGGGEAVVITCRKCKSEIRFEAPADEKTKPSNENPMSETAKTDSDATEENGPFIALSSGFFGGVPPVTGETEPLPLVAAKPAEPETTTESKPAAEASAESPKPAAAAPAETPKSAAEAPAEAAKPEPAAAEPEPAAAAAATAAEPAPMSEQPISSREMVFPDAVPDSEVMSVRGGDLESETVPLVVNKGSNGASANPFDPGTNPRLKKPLPPPRKAEKKPEPEDEPPPSGTPSLTSLMGSSVRPKPKNRVDEDFFTGISGPQATTLNPPTIDVSAFGAPASEPAPESAPPSSSEPAPDSIPVSTHTPHKKKKKKHGRTSSHAPAAPKTSAGATAKPVTKSARVSLPPEPQKSSAVPWVLLGLVVIGGGGTFMENKSQQSAAVEPAATAPAAATAEVAPTTPTTPTTTPTSEATAAPATASATASAAPTLNKPAEPALNKPADAKPAEAKPAEEKPADAKPAEEKPAEEKPAAAAVGAGFDQAAAKAALAASAAQASGCRKGEDPAGNAVVIITFAPSGRVTSANVNGPPFAGTATGGCIAAAMRKTQVPPFDGDRITVSKTVSIQ